MCHRYINRPPAILTTDAETELRFAVKFELDDAGNVVTYEDPRITRHYKIPGKFDVEGNQVWEERPVIRPKIVPCDYNDPDALARGRADIMMISDDTTYAMVYDGTNTTSSIDEDWNTSYEDTYKSYAIADVNMDGTNDYIEAGSNNWGSGSSDIRVFDGVTHSLLWQVTAPDVDGPGGVAAGDIDNDGIMEVVVSDFKYYGTPNYHYRIFIYDGRED